jgi:hypothetical protein
MKPKHRGRNLLIFLLLIITMSTGLTLVVNYLNCSYPVKPDILVVEGWMTTASLLEAKSAFQRNKYRYIVTTGFPHYNGYPMGYNGRMDFDFTGRIKSKADIMYSITLKARGTTAAGAFAHFRLFADSLQLGENYTAPHRKSYSYEVRLKDPPKVIRVYFDNDHFTSHEDRNLIVYSVSVNNETLTVNHDEVVYYYLRNGTYFFYERLQKSRAVSAANLLRSTGIRDSLVIPVESMHKNKSRTYTMAMDVKKWIMDNDNQQRHSITILTHGCHARRSYLTYKKAFGESADIGVISIPDRKFTPANWFLSTEGWKNLLYETAGLIYLAFFIKG